MLELADVINQVDLTDVYRTFHTSMKKYTFFSALHRTFSKTGHIPGTKQSLTDKTKLKYMLYLTWKQWIKVEYQEQQETVLEFEQLTTG